MKKFITKNKLFVLLLLSIFLAFVFLRFYELETKSIFTWDQVDNAWAAKSIIDDGEIPLVGMQAKGTTGIFIGPFYYYYITPFYFLTNLDPIASGIIAGVTAIISFVVFCFVFVKIINKKFALIGLFLLTVSSVVINYDRIQWPVNFVPILSFLIFLSLYKIITGNYKYSILLAASWGLFFHSHFTFILFVPIFLLTIPFFPKSKKALKFYLFSTLILFVLISPLLINSFLSGSINERNTLDYLATTSHGFHLRRFIQLADVAFVQFESSFFSLRYIGLIILPVFLFILYKTKIRKNLVLGYLSLLWFLIPWIIFSLYKGELTDYYFIMNLPIVIFIVSYFCYRLYSLRITWLSILITVLLIGYAFVNINKFFNKHHEGLSEYKERTQKRINKGQKIDFQMGVPDSYLYYIYEERK